MYKKNQHLKSACRKKKNPFGQNNGERCNVENASNETWAKSNPYIYLFK